MTSGVPRLSASGAHALAQRLALVGEGEFGAVRGERAGDAPGDGMVVGHAHDQAATALHQSGHAGTPRFTVGPQVAADDPKMGMGKPVCPMGDHCEVKDPRGLPLHFCDRPVTGSPHASTCFSTIVALVPPKPKEFDTTQPSLASSMRLRTIGMSAKRRIELLDMRALADEAVVHHQQRVDRLLHAGGAQRVAGERLGRRDRRALVGATEDLADGLDLLEVADRGRGAVRVDVVDLRADALSSAIFMQRTAPSPEGATMS
jgi:hypothetical protein